MSDQKKNTRDQKVIILHGEFYVAPLSYDTTPPMDGWNPARETRESYKARVRLGGLDEHGSPALGLTKDEALNLAARLRRASKRNRRRRA